MRQISDALTEIPQLVLERIHPGETRTPATWSISYTMIEGEQEPGHNLEEQGAQGIEVETGSVGRPGDAQASASVFRRITPIMPEYSQEDQPFLQIRLMSNLVREKSHTGFDRSLHFFYADFLRGSLVKSPVLEIEKETECPN